MTLNNYKESKQAFISLRCFQNLLTLNWEGEGGGGKGVTRVPFRLTKGRTVTQLGLPNRVSSFNRRKSCPSPSSQEECRIYSYRKLSSPLIRAELQHAGFPLSTERTSSSSPGHGCRVSSFRRREPRPPPLDRTTGFPLSEGENLVLLSWAGLQGFLFQKERTSSSSPGQA